MDDIEILVGLKKNDLKAFNLLYDTLYHQVRFFTSELVKDDPEAEDIAIDALAKFWEKGASDFESFLQIRKYIFTIAHNAAIDFLRKTKRQQAHLQQLRYVSPVIEESQVERTLLDIEMFEILLEEVEKLPEGCREVFKMVFLEKVPRVMVAERLQMPLNTVHWHCANAKKLLQKRFEEKGLIVLLLIIELCYI